MLQYTLLLLEVLLLGATAYIYWSTRKMVEEANIVSSTLPPQPGLEPDQVSVSQMTQDVATLISELHSVAGTTRDELLHQRAELTTAVEQAEAIIQELRMLLDQPEAAPVVGSADNAGPKPDFVPDPAPAPRPVFVPKKEEIPDPNENTEHLVTLDLIYSPSHFGEYLHSSGCGHDVANLAIEHAQEFVIWFANLFEDEPPPRRIDNQYLNDYLLYMETHDYDPNTIKRRFIALKAYLNWVNNISQLEEDGALSEPEPEPQPVYSVPPVQPVYVPPSLDQQVNAQLRHYDDPLVDIDEPVENGNSADPADFTKTLPDEMVMQTNEDRYNTVFALAEEGLDQLDIAARTGMEQEAVRMLLIMGQSAYAGT